MTRYPALRHAIVLLTAAMTAALPCPLPFPFGAAAAAQAKDPNAPPPAAATSRLLSRRYVDGERLHYVMKAMNDKIPYECRITATTRKGNGGGFVEEFAWTGLTVNGAPRKLAAAAQAFRLTVTLEGGVPFEPPDLSKAPGIIGPVTDLLTFYADLFLAMHQGALKKAGDRFYFESPSTASWADGTQVVLGEDHIDFDITLTSIDAGANTATLLIKHVPPPAPKISFPADWMRARVADAPNNWVQVRKTPAGFEASVGKETFDVTMTIDVASGKILSASMENPVTKVTRTCADAALTQCEEARPTPLVRRIALSLVPDQPPLHR